MARKYLPMQILKLHALGLQLRMLLVGVFILLLAHIDTVRSVNIHIYGCVLSSSIYRISRPYDM